MTGSAARLFGVMLYSAFVIACAGDESGEGNVPAAEVRDAIAAKIHAENDSVSFADPRSGTQIQLAFDHIHESVEKTPGGRYVACVDFRSAEGTVYDVDYYIDREGGGLHVESLVVHKVGGESVIADSTRARLESMR